MNSKKILIIDDEPDMLRYLSMFLSDEGFQVETAGDGPEGLERVKAGGIGLITLDINMPGMSGVEVFSILRSNPELKEIPVIVVTGVGDCRSALEARGAGPPEAYLEKPIDQVALLDTARRLMPQSGNP